MTIFEEINMPKSECYCLVRQRRYSAVDFIKVKKMTSRFDNWVKRCEELKLSPNCIKGLAFFLGLKIHKIKDFDKEEAIKKIDYFLDYEEACKLSNEINRELTQNLFFRTVMLIKAFTSLAKIEFPENRLNSDGKPTTLFDPYIEQEIFEYDEGKLVDFHKRYENLFEQIGEGFELANCSYEHAFVYSEKFAIQAVLEDAHGYQFFDYILGANGVLPPIFERLLEEGWNLINLKEEGYLPFQTALGGYICGLDIDLVDYIWGCQKVLFFDQTTLEKINLGFQWGSTLDFIRLLNHYGESYFSHETIKAHIQKQLPLFKSQKDIDFDWYKIVDDTNLFEFLIEKIKDKDGYDYNIEEELSESNRLQFKAAFFFMFIYGIAANPDSLKWSGDKDNS